MRLTGDRLSVMGIDPGKTTGIVVWNGQDPWTGSHIARYQLDKASAIKLIQQWCMNVKTRDIPILIGCETFIPRVSGAGKRLSTQLDAQDIIGGVKVIVEQNEIPISWHPPALAKRAVKDTTLKALKWWFTGQDHANDAARHVGAALLTHYSEVYYTLLHRAGVIDS